MSWKITLNGDTYSSLDLTLGEVEALERISGEPWVLINPFAKVACARAYLAVFSIRNGMSDSEVTAYVNALTLRELQDAFEWVDDKAEADPPARKGKRAKGKGKELDPTSAAHSSPRTSGGGPNGTDGHPTSPAPSGSGTS